MAQRVGLKVGDEILEIDNIQVRTMTLQELHYKLSYNSNANFIIKSGKNIKEIKLNKTNICIRVRDIH